MRVSIDSAICALVERFGTISVLTGEAVRNRPASKQMPSGCEAAALLRPACTQELSEMVSMCAQYKVPVVPRAGMTGLVGGTIAGPDEIALSLERMVGVVSVDVDAQTMIVKAGTPLQIVHDTADHHGLQFPLDLGARGSATIGGMLATNAGGNKVVRYGMIRDMVLGMEVVLPNGKIMDSMFGLLKNNTGLDVKQLFIGTEGTLGIITQAVLRLYPPTHNRHASLCAFTSFDALVATLQHVRTLAGPALTSFEVMWRDYYDFVTQPGRLRAPLPNEHAIYALIECEHPSNAPECAENSESFAGMLQTAMELGHVTDAVIAQSEAERAALWLIRDEVHFLRELRPMFGFDISLPIRHMAVYLEDLRTDILERWPQAHVICYGHVGDGNLHLAISCGQDSDAAQVESLVYGPLPALGGSVSAEHGIGLFKKPYLMHTRSDVEREVMECVKAALDPDDLFNPGKIL